LNSQLGPLSGGKREESRFLAFAKKAGLPRPEVNAHPRAFERDRARDRAMHADGWRVVRITWRQLGDEPERIAPT